MKVVWKLGLRPRNYFSGNTKMRFSFQCMTFRRLFSIGNWCASLAELFLQQVLYRSCVLLPKSKKAKRENRNSCIWYSSHEVNCWLNGDHRGEKGRGESARASLLPSQLESIPQLFCWWQHFALPSISLILLRELRAVLYVPLLASALNFIWGVAEKLQLPSEGPCEKPHPLYSQPTKVEQLPVITLSYAFFFSAFICTAFSAGIIPPYK